MLTAALVVTAPALSLARTVSTCLPDATFGHVNEYGAVVARPSTVVPSRNSTCVTLPSGSLALAVIVIVALFGKTAPAAGEVMLAVGGRFAGLTVILDAALVVVAPTSSAARAVSVYVPAATPLQAKLYGA